jgi:uncharacterized protein (TIGR02246 family)
MDDQKALRDLVSAADRHQSDVDEFVALHHRDVVIVNIAGRRVLGRDALRDAMTAALRSPLAKVLTRLDVEDIRLVGPDVALVSCAKHVFDQRDTGRDTGPALPATGSLTFTAVREPDGWKIALAQTTPVG